MKNLIRQDLKRKFDTIRKSDRLLDRKRHYKSIYHQVDGISPWKRVKRVIEAHIGKNFDTAFSVYCSQVPVYQQKLFLEEFQEGGRFWWRRSELWDYYYLDKNNCIKKHVGLYKKQKRQQGVYFYSDDYRTERRHKLTGKAYPKYTWMDKKFKEEDYENVVVEGYFLKFSSPKDPEFIRLTTDQRKRRAAAQREAEKEAMKKAYSFISKDEKKLKEEKAMDKIKIEAKGFDYETSFRGENQINPDVIKERQGF